MKRVLVAALLLAVGCTQTPSGSTEKQVPSSGGTVEVTEGPIAGTKLEIADGALPDGAKITIAPGKAITSSYATGVGPAVELGPTGTTFVEPATLTLPFDAA